MALEACQEIRNKLGTEKFVQAYNMTWKSLKLKREKRNQGEKRDRIQMPFQPLSCSEPIVRLISWPKFQSKTGLESEKFCR